RMRGKFRSLRLSLSRPRSSRALDRIVLARTALSPDVRLATAWRSRSNASSRRRRSPLIPIASVGSARAGTAGRGPRWWGAGACCFVGGCVLRGARVTSCTARQPDLELTVLELGRRKEATLYGILHEA